MIAPSIGFVRVAEIVQAVVPALDHDLHPCGLAIGGGDEFSKSRLEEIALKHDAIALRPLGNERVGGER